jgi:hypothetical protein
VTRQSTSAADLWLSGGGRHHALGNVILVRYADDIVAGFEHQADAERFEAELRDRFGPVCADPASGQDLSDPVGRVQRVICRCRQGFEEFGCACPDTVGGQSPFSQHSDQIVSTLGLGGLHH